MDPGRDLVGESDAHLEEVEADAQVVGGDVAGVGLLDGLGPGSPLGAVFDLDSEVGEGVVDGGGESRVVFLAGGVAHIEPG